MLPHLQNLPEALTYNMFSQIENGLYLQQEILTVMFRDSITLLHKVYQFLKSNIFWATYLVFITRITIIYLLTFKNNNMGKKQQLSQAQKSLVVLYSSMNEALQPWEHRGVGKQPSHTKKSTCKTMIYYQLLCTIFTVCTVAIYSEMKHKSMYSEMAKK